MRRVPAEVTYQEGIYVGYRYYDTYKVPVSYEFGYGLSYSAFSYSNLKLSSTAFNNEITVSIDVKNTGKVPGREVAEVYLSAPSKKLDKPAKELKAFGKTRLLKPGESQTLSFIINSRDLASFDTASSSWIADAGNYKVSVGSSSRDIRQTGSFSLAGDLTVEKDSQALQPHREIVEFNGKDKPETLY